jgi:hypothetical protein
MRFKALLLILGCWSGLQAQPPKRFYTMFGGSDNDYGRGIKLVNEKDYIVIGSTASYGSGSSDAYLAYVDSMGTPKWAKSFGGPGSESGQSIVVNPADSGYVFCGYANSFGSGDYDFYVVRTDKFGNKLWEKTFGTAEWEFASDLIITTDLNLLVCGYTYGGKYGQKDATLLKLKLSDGTFLSRKDFGGTKSDEFLKIRLTSDGYYTIAGNTNSYNDIVKDIWMFKLNSAGDSIDSKCLGAIGKMEVAYDFVEDKQNNLVFCGAIDTSASNAGKNVSYLYKSSLTGTFIKDKREPGAFHNDDKLVAIDNGKIGNIFFLTRKVFHQGGYFGIDIQPMVYDYNLDVWFSNTYGGNGVDEGLGMVTTWDNGCAIIGYTSGFDLGSTDVFLVKLRTALDSSNVMVVGNEEIIPEKPPFYYIYGRALYFPHSVITRSYSILNLIGQEIYKGTLQSSPETLPIGLSSGVYFLCIDKSSSRPLKFILDNGQ